MRLLTITETSSPEEVLEQLLKELRSVKKVAADELRGQVTDIDELIRLTLDGMHPNRKTSLLADDAWWESMFALWPHLAPNGDLSTLKEFRAEIRADVAITFSMDVGSSSSIQKELPETLTT